MNDPREDALDEAVSAAFSVRMRLQDEGLNQESIGAAAVQDHLKKLLLEHRDSLTRSAYALGHGNGTAAAASVQIGPGDWRETGCSCGKVDRECSACLLDAATSYERHARRHYAAVLESMTDAQVKAYSEGAAAGVKQGAMARLRARP